MVLASVPTVQQHAEKRSAASTAAALTESKHFARRCGLGQKQLLHLRLLSEELLGMARSVVDVKRGVFLVEKSQANTIATLRMNLNMLTKDLTAVISAKSDAGKLKDITQRIWQCAAPDPIQKTMSSELV